MKILLVAINAKYIHSCPAVYALRAYSGEYSQYVEIAEYTINDRYEDILSGIMEAEADAIGFSCYIWNADYTRQLIRDIRSICDDTQPLLFAGGPEATNSPQAFLDMGADFIIRGEGERPFRDLTELLAKGEIVWKKVAGLSWYEKKENGKILLCSPDPKPLSMDSLPFLYDNLVPFDNRIIYYESSRGCPFRCSYCLSSIEKSVRLRNMDTVKKELQFFLDHAVRQVKFVDRTFNCNHAHAMEIWRYIGEHDNGITNFHFEIGADIVSQEEISLLNTLRPGLVQMEIGVQSTNQETIGEVNRTMDLGRLTEVVNEIRRGNNINLHLDLIAGLPYEAYERFAESFNDVYAMRANQFQLGFLKVLPGTVMHDKAESYGMVWSERAPYEIYRTKWISYREICRLHEICDMLDLFYNSQQFIRTLPVLEKHFADPFEMYEQLSCFFRRKGYRKNIPAQKQRYEVLKEFAAEHTDEKGMTEILEYLKFDFALHYNKSRHMVYSQVLDLGEGPVEYVFDYQKKNPLNAEAEYHVVK